MHVNPEDQTLCPVCGELVVSKKNVTEPDGAWHFVDCHYCGRFYIDHALPYNLNAWHPSTRHLLSGAIRKLGRQCPVLSPETIASCLSLAPRNFDVTGKSRRLLAGLAKKCRTLGEEVSIQVRDAPLGYVHDSSEVYFLFDHLRELGFVEERRAKILAPMRLQQPEAEVVGGVVLTALGWEELSSKPNAQHDTAFTAMWFNEATSAAWSVGIRPALEEDCGWRAERIDLEEHNR